MAYRIKQVSEEFDILGDFVSAAAYGTGHINDTFRVVYDQGGTEVHYLFQRINHRVFKNPPLLMENIERVTTHITEKIKARGQDASRRALCLVKARDGAAYVRDAEGDYWRSYIFIELAKTYDVLQSADQAFQAAKAFGEFQKELADLPLPRLHETIPDFHHTPKRIDALEAAILRDSHNRVRSARREIDFVMARRDETACLIKLNAAGDIPERVTHNDTKLNNVMLDDATGEGICVIDLDTVMPGLVLYDFGDMVRSAVSPAAEDERDVGKVGVRMCMFEALVDGYLDSAEFLNATERGLLPAAGKVISFESGIRFLTDYLWGDVYFKTHREGHNLDRCRTQFQLVRSIEEHEEQMNAYVASWTQGRGRCSKYA